MNTWSGSLARRTVLYVEDHAVNAMLMSALFEQRPQLRLVIARDGAEALQVAPSLSPDLLLLDLRLPDCHGIHLLSLLRRIEGFEFVPAVAVTAEFEIPGEGSEFCEVWTKPLDLAHVLERLDWLMTKDRATGAAMAMPREAWESGMLGPHAY